MKRERKKPVKVNLKRSRLRQPGQQCLSSDEENKGQKFVTLINYNNATNEQR